MVVLVLLAVVLLLDRRTFDSRQVTGTIVGYETNMGKIAAVLVAVTNKSPRIISYGGVSVFYDGAIFVSEDDGFGRGQNIPPGQARTLKVPIEPHGELTEILITFETAPWSSKAPAWMRRLVPDRLTKRRSFEVSAKPKDVPAR